MNRLTISSVLAALALGAGGAHADDSYPGYSCLINSDDASRAGSKIQNTSLTDNKTFACPVVRSNMLAGLPGGSTAVVIDQHFTDDISCTLRASDADGNVVSHSTRKTSGSNSTPTTLSFGNLPMVAGGHYTLYCTVPAVYSGVESAIVSYTILD